MRGRAVTETTVRHVLKHARKGLSDRKTALATGLSASTVGIIRRAGSFDAYQAEIRSRYKRHAMNILRDEFRGFEERLEALENEQKRMSGIFFRFRRK